MKIGIAGKTGSGKSTVAQWFVEKHHFYRIDLDRVGKDVLDNSSRARHLLRERLPEIFINGELLERSRIANIVFKNTKKLGILNAVLHPEMKSLVYRTIQDNKNESIVIDGAVLFEMGLARLCDPVIFITVPFNAAQKRSSREPEDFQRIWEYQEFLNDRQEQAGIIIDNSGTIEGLYQRLEEISKEILKIKEQREG